MKPVAQFRKPVVLLALGFAALALSVLMAIWSSVMQDKAVGWVRHTLEVESRLNTVARLITQAETGQRGFLITGQKPYLEPYHQALTELPARLAQLEEVVQDNDVQRPLANRLKALTRTRLAILDESVVLTERGAMGEAVDVVRSGRGRQAMRQIETVLNAMLQEEGRLLAERSAVAERRTLLARAFLAFCFVLAVLVAVVALRQANERVDALEDTIARLNDEMAARTDAQSQVRQLQKMDAVGQLTGGIAHDFNNMLAIIMSALDLARRRLQRGDTAGVEQTLDHAQEGANRAAGLTAQLLAFARRQPLEPRVLDPNKLVSGISELLRRTLGEQVKIETVLAGGLWRVHADPEQLESSLINLAVNARDAMPGGGKLTIETANTELDERYARMHEEVEAGQYVMLSVTDTGTGMTPEIIERAFEPFFTTKDVGRGTGLGLSQVFGFVKQSSGHVKVYSEPGDGTTVKIYLPRFVGVLAPMIAATLASDLPLARADELILVVEDEPQVRRLSVDALAELGYEVVEASDGAEALEQLALNPRIALLFTDIVMPGMSGRALADRAQADRPELRVLYTTGYTRNAIVHNGVVDYGVAFIQKPFTIASLARKVREVLDGE